MLKYFKKKKNYKLYLGEISVVERNDLKSIFDQPNSIFFEKSNTRLWRKLVEIFELPLVRNEPNLTNECLAIDIAVPKYQGGGAFLESFGSVALPFFWRPKVNVRARIYQANSNKTLYDVEVVTALPWKQFLSRFLSPLFLLGIEPPYKTKDLENLLFQGCSKAIAKLSHKFHT
ncbi:hypothetical protein EOPP23_20950 [Endozoicomonas sp. OPT23]|uniref:hypothetical protein n=1 Tax=Endozoicomonas sp. OPT23 TaxID=2072845 RepID=UPI00129BD3B0|nr:hypothetical protein [Endozoicomonas sp. OPT23]MRI35432.1 hypothetical protein [Endozoicomonas sp. OPT23]